MDVFSDLSQFLTAYVGGLADTEKPRKKKKKNSAPVSWETFAGTWTLDNEFSPAKEMYTISAKGEVSIVGVGNSKVAVAGSKGDTEKDENYLDSGTAFLPTEAGKWQYLWVSGCTLYVHSFDSTVTTSGRSPRGSPHFVRASEGRRGMGRMTTQEFRAMRDGEADVDRPEPETGEPQLDNMLIRGRGRNPWVDREPLELATEMDCGQYVQVLTVTCQRGHGGTYTLVKGEMPNGMPLWKNDSGDDYFFSGQDGKWYIGDEDEKLAHFQCSSGNISSKDSHKGTMPHEMPAGAWCFYSGDWHVAPGILVQACSDVKKGTAEEVRRSGSSSQVEEKVAKTKSKKLSPTATKDGKENKKGDELELQMGKPKSPKSAMGKTKTSEEKEPESPTGKTKSTKSTTGRAKPLKSKSKSPRPSDS